MSETPSFEAAGINASAETYPSLETAQSIGRRARWFGHRVTNLKLVQLGDTVKPAPVQQQITALRVSPARFRAARRGAAIARRPRVRVGAKVIYSDTSVGETTFTLSAYVHARCRHGARRHARSCPRLLVLARFVRTDSAGTNGFRLTGLLRGYALKPGGYLLTATPGAVASANQSP